MDWRTPLYDYVQARNRLASEYKLELLSPHVTDEVYLQLQERRLARLRQSHRESGLRPVRSETRLRVIGTEQREGAICAAIELAQQFQYDGAGHKYTEERIERERVRLEGTPGGGTWIVGRIEPDIRELGDDSMAPVPAAAKSDPWLAGTEPRPDTGTGAAEQAGPPFVHGGPLLNPAVLPQQSAEPPRAVRYNRDRARQYAHQWWNAYNPAYVKFEVDCSSYVCQCLFAGGAPMNYTGRRDSGWWYRGKSGGRELWSYSWAVANSLRLYLSGSRTGLRAVTVHSPAYLTIGDVISYSWKGDGNYGHSTIVTGVAPNGLPLVNAHTVNSRSRYWDYRDSYAYTDRTAYKFFHIVDAF